MTHQKLRKIPTNRETTADHNCHNWKFYTVILSLVVIAYSNSLNCELVFDDIPAIVENGDIRPQTSFLELFKHDFWGTPLIQEGSHKSYRPICVLTFRLNFWFHQLKPTGYHLVNVILHGIVTILYFRFCRLFLKIAPSFMAAALFAVHPIHTEAVTGVVGRSELLCSIFFLSALKLYISCVKSRKRCDILFFFQFFALVAVSMLSKEQGISVAGICIIYDIIPKSPCCRTKDRCPRGKIKGPTPTWRKDLVLRLLFLCSTTLLLLLYRMKIMGSKMPIFSKFDNPASVSSTPVRQLTYNYLLSLNNWLLLFPFNLLCDWTMGTVPLVTSYADYRNVSTVFFYLSLCALIWRCWSSCSNRRAVVVIGLSLWTFPFLPASNLFFPVGFVIAERVLYIPSMGFCFLVSYGWSILWSICKRSVRVVLILSITFILCLNTLKVIRRNSDWMSEEMLFKSGIKVTEQNAKLWNNVGHISENRGDHHRAMEFYQKAAHVQPDDLGSFFNIGRVYNALEMHREAEDAFWKAKSLFPAAERASRNTVSYVVPRHLELFQHLADLVSRNSSRLREAEQLYKEAIDMKRDYTAAYMSRANILVKLNRSRDAHDTYKQALKHDHKNPDIYYNIGVLLLKEGNNIQALKNFDRALTINPEHEKSLINYAILSQDVGDYNLRKIAQERLEGILKKGATLPERIFLNLGMLAMEDKEYKSAEEYFKRAIEQRANFDTALFNLAFLFYNTKRPMEAVPYLENLAKTHQNHTKGLMLLGNIYFSYMRNYTAAKECYMRILERNNVYVPALHNLCAVHVEMDQFDIAEKCLLKALELAPAEGYIEDHLKIVREHLEKNRQKVNHENLPESATHYCDNQTCNRPLFV